MKWENVIAVIYFCSYIVRNILLCKSKSSLINRKEMYFYQLYYSVCTTNPLVQIDLVETLADNTFLLISQYYVESVNSC